MNAKVSRQFAFQAAVHYDSKFLINSYELDMIMEVTTEDVREQNIALDRIKYLLDMCLDSCVFADISEKNIIEGYLKAGMRVCTLPDEPYDQIVGAVLLNKFNAITEGKIVISEIKISSKICDDVSFYVSYDEDMIHSTNTDYWWKQNNVLISDTQKRVSKRDKIVELKKEIVDWVDVGLTWKPKQKSKTSKGDIVFIGQDISPN